MRKRIVLEPGEHRGFKRGMSLVTMGNIADVRKLLHALVGGTQCKLQYYINGTTVIRREMAEAITEILVSHGVPEDQIFDD